MSAGAGASKHIHDETYLRGLIGRPLVPFYSEGDVNSDMTKAIDVGPVNVSARKWNAAEGYYEEERPVGSNAAAVHVSGPEGARIEGVQRPKQGRARDFRGPEHGTVSVENEGHNARDAKRQSPNFGQKSSKSGAPRGHERAPKGKQEKREESGGAFAWAAYQAAPSPDALPMPKFDTASDSGSNGLQHSRTVLAPKVTQTSPGRSYAAAASTTPANPPQPTTGTRLNTGPMQQATISLHSVFGIPAEDTTHTAEAPSDTAMSIGKPDRDAYGRGAAGQRGAQGDADVRGAPKDAGQAAQVQASRSDPKRVEMGGAGVIEPLTSDPVQFVHPALATNSVPQAVNTPFPTGMTPESLQAYVQSQATLVIMQAQARQFQQMQAVAAVRQLHEQHRNAMQCVQPPGGTFPNVVGIPPINGNTNFNYNGRNMGQPSPGANVMAMPAMGQRSWQNAGLPGNVAMGQMAQGPYSTAPNGVGAWSQQIHAGAPFIPQMQPGSPRPIVGPALLQSAESEGRQAPMDAQSGSSAASALLNPADLQASGSGPTCLPAAAAIEKRSGVERDQGNPWGRTSERLSQALPPAADVPLSATAIPAALIVSEAKRAPPKNMLAPSQARKR